MSKKTRTFKLKRGWANHSGWQIECGGTGQRAKAVDGGLMFPGLMPVMSGLCPMTTSTATRTLSSDDLLLSICTDDV